ncbi:MAG TPA: alkaline phosphatase family protein [Candidatus Elarobacter sp.]|nr:alkaline phosphatase family protein [Candidatus Elarobacter sp.]
MKRIRGAITRGAVALATLTLACARETPPPRPTPSQATSSLAGKFAHVIIVVLENENAATVLGVPAMDSLAAHGVLLRNYYAVAHPSYPNYLAMVSGNTFVGAGPHARHDPDAYRALDMGDAQLLIDAPSVIDGLEAKGLTWNAFAEDYPETSASPVRCDFRRQVGKYARKHFPLLSFSGFRTHPAWCQHVRDLRWFSKDSLAAYTFIAPNLEHDGHDAPLDTAVTWLGTFLQPLLADSATMSRTLVVVTFDESANPLSEMIAGTHPNRVYTVLLGGMLSGHVSDRVYSHYSLLRTIEDDFGLPHLGPANVSPITDVWK